MFNQNLRTILDSFIKTIDKLDALINRNTARLDVNTARRGELRTESDVLADENARAIAVVVKLRDLIAA